MGKNEYKDQLKVLKFMSGRSWTTASKISTLSKLHYYRVQGIVHALLKKEFLVADKTKTPNYFKITQKGEDELLKQVVAEQLEAHVLEEN